MNPAKGIRHLAARFEIPAAMAGMKKTKTNTKPKRTPSASQARSTDDTAPAAAVESNGKGTRRPDVAATNLPPPPTVRHRLPPRGKKASVSAPQPSPRTHGEYLARRTNRRHRPIPRVSRRPRHRRRCFAGRSSLRNPQSGPRLRFLKSPAPQSCRTLRGIASSKTCSSRKRPGRVPRLRAQRN